MSMLGRPSGLTFSRESWIVLAAMKAGPAGRGTGAGAADVSTSPDTTRDSGSLARAGWAGWASLAGWAGLAGGDPFTVVRAGTNGGVRIRLSGDGGAVPGGTSGAVALARRV